MYCIYCNIYNVIYRFLSFKIYFYWCIVELQYIICFEYISILMAKNCLCPFIHPFIIHLFSQLFIEHLLCSRCYSRYSRDQSTISALLGPLLCDRSSLNTCLNLGVRHYICGGGWPSRVPQAICCSWTSTRCPHDGNKVHCHLVWFEWREWGAE